MPYRVLVDDEAWARAGEELKKLDPQRYIAILRTVEDIVRIHRDPLDANAASGHFIFMKRPDGDPD